MFTTKKSLLVIFVQKYLGQKDKCRITARYISQLPAQDVKRRYQKTQYHPMNVVLLLLLVSNVHMSPIRNTIWIGMLGCTNQKTKGEKDTQVKIKSLV